MNALYQDSTSGIVCHIYMEQIENSISQVMQTTEVDKRCMIQGSIRLNGIVSWGAYRKQLELASPRYGGKIQEL